MIEEKIGIELLKVGKCRDEGSAVCIKSHYPLLLRFVHIRFEQRHSMWSFFSIRQQSQIPRHVWVRKSFFQNYSLEERFFVFFLFSFSVFRKIRFTRKLLPKSLLFNWYFFNFSKIWNFSKILVRWFSEKKNHYLGLRFLKSASCQFYW